ncbi:MAG: endonuclease/exonuclease/phosphatase family protein [Thiobacillus sp.]
MNAQGRPDIAGTLTLATCNVLNLALPGRSYYANQEPYTAQEYQRKIDWLGDSLKNLNADIVAVQEIWDEAALQEAVKASGLRYRTVKSPGAENTDASGKPLPGAEGTPRVGFITRLETLALQSYREIDPAMHADVPDIGPHVRFERPPLHLTVKLDSGQPLHVLTVHMKSKRPKFLQAADGNYLEDTDDPKIQARATLRSLIMRGVEAAALRGLIVDVVKGRQGPLIVMGDFNDGPHSVTTQILAATSEVAYDRAASDVALFNAYELQGQAGMRRDVAYSHVHQGRPDILDQIFVSEEFLRSSKYAVGDVARVDYFNDHLHQGRDRSRSDHGFVRAVLRLYGQAG